MRASVLDPSEYHRLQESGEPQVYPYMDPLETSIVAVEEDGEILGYMTVTKVTHFESVWIRPEKRGNPRVVASLLGAGFAVADDQGAAWVMGGAEDGNDVMKSYLERLGGLPIAARFYSLPVRRT